jgi:hypothetical protein
VVKLVQVEEVAPRPWRNGGGIARDLLRWPDADDPALQVSVADIEADGPFSSYEGIDRWFGVLEGDGVELRWRKAVRRIDPGRSLLHFDGDLAPSCELIGSPVRALNILHKRGSGPVLVQPAGSYSSSPPGFRRFALFCRDTAYLFADNAPPVAMMPMSFAWGDGSAQIEMAPNAAAWWIAFDGAPR